LTDPQGTCRSNGRKKKTLEGTRLLLRRMPALSRWYARVGGGTHNQLDLHQLEQTVRGKGWKPKELSWSSLKKQKKGDERSIIVTLIWISWGRELGVGGGLKILQKRPTGQEEH